MRPQMNLGDCSNVSRDRPRSAAKLPTLRTALLFALLSTGAVAACEDEVVTTNEGAPPPTSASAAASEFKLPSLAKSGSASASAGVSAMPAVSIDVPSGPVKWTDFSGPFGRSELSAGSAAWAVAPVSAGWETLKFSWGTVERVEEKEVVFKLNGPDKAEIWVPSAFCAPAPKVDGLVKGDAVMVPARGSRAFARVTGVEGSKVKVRYRFAGDVQELEVESNMAIKLDGNLKFGAPVGFQDRAKGPGGEDKLDWFWGQLVNVAEEKAWLVTSTGKPRRVGLSAVKPLKLSVSPKVGDKVWAGRGEDLLPGVVSEVVDDGLRFKVKLENGEDTSASFDSVTTPLK